MFRLRRPRRVMPARRHQPLLAVGDSEQRYLDNGCTDLGRTKSAGYASRLISIFVMVVMLYLAN